VRDLKDAVDPFVGDGMGAEFVWEIAQHSSTSEVLEIPMWMVYMAVPLGSYLMCFRFLQMCIKGCT